MRIDPNPTVISLPNQGIISSSRLVNLLRPILPKITPEWIPIASQRDEVRTVAWANIKPRIPIVTNPPVTRKGSANCENARGKSSKPEYQFTARICSRAGLRKWTIEKRTDTKMTAGNGANDWRSNPRIAPRKKTSSMIATEIAVSATGGSKCHGMGSLSSKSPSASKMPPNPMIVPDDTRNPPTRCSRRREFPRRPRLLNLLAPIHRTVGNKSRKAEIRTDRLKKR